MEIVFSVEGESEKKFLNAFFTKSEWLDKGCFRILKFEGKRDLLKRFTNIMKSWGSSKGPTRFVVLVDQDGEDCRELKQKIQEKIQDIDNEKCIVCIACRELEAWYLANPDELQKVYPLFSKIRNKKHFREDPSNIKQPARMLDKHIPEFRKIEAAERMGEELGGKFSKSSSIGDGDASGFRNFISGIMKLRDSRGFFDKSDLASSSRQEGTIE